MKRILSFKIMLYSDLTSKFNREKVTIDGVGGVSHPLRLCAERRPLSSLSQTEQDSIKHILTAKTSTLASDIVEILLLENDGRCGQKIEQWALEYTSKFVHAAGPEFYSTTIGQILGTAYVKKNLPEVSKLSKYIPISSLTAIV
jgi:hypothetical protein